MGRHMQLATKLTLSVVTSAAPILTKLHHIGETVPPTIYTLPASFMVSLCWKTSF